MRKIDLNESGAYTASSHSGTQLSYCIRLFDEEPDWVYQLFIKSSRSLISANLNGDSFADRVLGNHPRDSIQTFIGIVDGSFDLLHSIPLDDPKWLETSDVDLDGDQDVIAMCYCDDSTYVMLNDGLGNLSTPVKIYNDNVLEIFTVSLFDADSLSDILMVDDYEGGNVYLACGNGDGSFEEGVRIYVEDYGDYALDAADIDSDGDQDSNHPTL